MADTEGIIRRAAEAIQERWSIGDYSRFCDDPPDFDPASTEDVMDVIRPFFEEATPATPAKG